MAQPREKGLLLYLVRALAGLSILLYALASIAVERWPSEAAGYPSSSWLLLLVLGFGIIGVRLGGSEAIPSHREARRVWPYVLGGIIAVAAIIYWATSTWAPLWRVTIGIYASAMLATIMLVMFEE